MAAKRDYDALFKMVIIGDSGVGKSSLLLRFADDTFTATHTSTLGVDFRFKTVDVDDKRVKLQIWDTAGQERFRTITSAYYRGADGIFIVFDVAHRESFEHVRDWAAEVSKYAAPGIPRLLIGNKSDRSDRVVTEAEGQSLAESLSMHYLETSAKTAERVTDAFNALTAELLAKKSAAPAERNNNDGSVTVSGQGSTGKSGCC